MEKFLKLSRAEMKNILGGLADPGCTGNCKTDADCFGEMVCTDTSSELCPDRKECKMS